MNIRRMAIKIIGMLDGKYKTNKNDYLDIEQIKSICKLSCPKNDNISVDSVSLNDITFDTPEFVRDKKSKKSQDPLKSEEFKKRYDFFIQILYCCLKLNIEIFDSEHLILINNYHLIKAIETKKKKYIRVHIDKLKELYKSSSEQTSDSYFTFIDNYKRTITTLDGLLKSVKKLVDNKILDLMDNLQTLVIPYFYKNTEYIEEYNADG